MKAKYQTNIMQRCLLVELFGRFDHFWPRNTLTLGWMPVRVHLKVVLYLDISSYKEPSIHMYFLE